VTKVNFYLPLVEQRSEPEEPGTSGYVTYGTDEFESMLLAYTCLQSLAGGMKACAATSGEHDYVGFQQTDPFELSEILGYLEAHGLKYLLFDPPPAPDGEVWVIGSPIPVGEYRNAIEEIRPLFEKLGAEAKARFCRPSHLENEPFVRWPNARAETIAADLRARIEELLDCDDC
jgi:hypothetical protein